MKRALMFVGVLLLVVCTVSQATAAGPGLAVSAPLNGDQLMGTSFTIKFSVTDFNIVPSTVPLSEAGKHPELNHPGEGHLHFMLDLQPLVVWDRNEPYKFTNLAPGNHQLMVELANNDHSSLSPPVVQQINFTSELPLPGTGQDPSLPLDAGMAAWVLGIAILVAGALLVVRTGRTTH